jgi:biopolymer transport protein ExbB/TolQ
MKTHLPYLIVIAVLIYLLATCNRGKVNNDDTKEQLKTALSAKKRALDSVDILQAYITAMEEKELHDVAAYDDLMLQFMDLKDSKAQADKNVTALINEFSNVKDTIAKLKTCAELAIAAQKAKEECDKAIENGTQSLRIQGQGLDNKDSQIGLLNRQVQNLSKALDTCGKSITAALPAIVQYRYFSLGGELGALMPGNGFAMGVIEYHTVNGYHISGSFGFQGSGEKVGSVRVTKIFFKIKKR